MADTYDPSADSAKYLITKRRAQEAYDIGKANQDYNETLAKNTWGSTQGNLNYTWNRARDNAAWAGANKGFGKTGSSYGRAMESYNQGRTTAWDQALRSHQQQMDSIARARAELLRQRDTTIQDADLSEAERKMNLASQLRGASSGGVGGGGADASGQQTTADGTIIARPFAGDGGGGTLLDENGNPVYADDEETLKRLGKSAVLPSWDGAGWTYNTFTPQPAAASPTAQKAVSGATLGLSADDVMGMIGMI